MMVKASLAIALVLAGCGSNDTPTGGWRVSKEPGAIVASISSAAGFEDSTHGKRTPALRLVCNPNLYFVYLDFGTGEPIEEGGVGAAATVSYALDGGPSVLAKAVHVARERLWIRDAGLMRKIFSGHTIAVEFRPFEGSGVVRSSFSLEGLTPAVRNQGEGCFDPLIAAKN
jgi:hypothetical protein